MTEQEALQRITIDPSIIGGKPFIRSMRVAVERALGMLAAGDTPARVLSEYPFLETEEIRACTGDALSNPLHGN